MCCSACLSAFRGVSISPAGTGGIGAGVDAASDWEALISFTAPSSAFCAFPAAIAAVVAGKGSWLGFVVEVGGVAVCGPINVVVPDAGAACCSNIDTAMTCESA